MTDASYSHKFMRALADSLGWNPEAVQKALTEIAQLQNQTKELELSVQGKAPTNHASQQAVFGLADERMYGHVKVTHEVTNDSTAGVAVSPDAVYAYAPNRDTTPLGTVTRTMATVINDGKSIPDGAYAQISGNAVALCWGNPGYTNISRIDVFIPDIYKFEIFDDYITCTNSGDKIIVSYEADNLLSVQIPDAIEAFGSILILMAPKNV